MTDQHEFVAPIAARRRPQADWYQDLRRATGAAAALSRPVRLALIAALQETAEDQGREQLVERQEAQRAARARLARTASRRTMFNLVAVLVILLVDVVVVAAIAPGAMASSNGQVVSVIGYSVIPVVLVDVFLAFFAMGLHTLLGLDER